MIKTCTKCGEIKSINLFDRDKQKSDGLCSRCKCCRRIDAKRDILRHGERRKAYSKKYYIKNKNRISEYLKKWYQENKEREKKKHREWKKKNRSLHLASTRK